jgi:hypothetical protein
MLPGLDSLAGPCGTVNEVSPSSLLKRIDGCGVIIRGYV